MHDNVSACTMQLLLLAQNAGQTLVLDCVLDGFLSLTGFLLHVGDAVGR